MITTPTNFRDNHVVVIDSLDRNLAKYPDPANYTVALPETLRNIETIELMSFQLTRTETNVNSNNNKFIIAELITLSTNTTTTNIYNVEIPIGEYANSANLVTALQSNLPQNYTASLNTVTNKITIYAPQTPSVGNTRAFCIQIDENAAKLLGIAGIGVRGSGVIYSGPLSGTNIGVEGKNSIDLAGIPYIVVHINDYERIVSPGSASHKNFLVIPMENHELGKRFIISGDQKEKKGIYILTNNQKNMYEMRVSIRRPDGTLYDFKGTDHLLIFRIYRHDYRDFNS
jgi:hypothetical protein